jgi:hypothetical protein
MNILIDFLVTNFSKKFGLSKDHLKNYMLYQTNNSGVIYNGELLKADNEEKLIYLTKELARHYKQQKNIDIFINKVNYCRHRFIYECFNGPIINMDQIDHINNNKLERDE